MTVDERLQAALQGLELPVYPHVYTGPAARYLVTHYDTVPLVFADRTPGAARYLVQVHVFLPDKESPLETLDAVCLALFEAQFTWPGITDASDADGQHYVLECETVDGGGYYRGNDQH